MVAQARMKAIRVFIFLGVMMKFFLNVYAQERPVVVELFTWEDCANCGYAEAAIDELRNYYTREEVVFLTFFREGENLIPAGVTRPRLYYGLDTRETPIATFNGLSRIEGAKSGIITSYRENIEQRLDWSSSWSMSAWMRIQDASVTASVQWIGDATPARPLDLHFAWVQRVRGESQCLVQDFQTVAQVQQSQASAAITMNPLNLKGNGRLDGFWILQDGMTKEILQAQFCYNLSTFRRDLNGDGEINALDLFYFSTVWYAEDERADLDRDGKVERKDLLLFRGSGG